MCAIAQVSRAGYYKWLNRGGSAVDLRNAEVAEKIREIYEASGKVAGYRRVRSVLLRDHGIRCNKKRVYRIMQRLGLKSIIKRKRPQYSGAADKRSTAENILNRQFTAEEFNQKWLTDVTEFQYGAGRKMYLSAILDLKGNDIVAYEIGHNNNNQLVFKTFDAAISKYPNAKPLFHSDRGFQYTNAIFRSKLERQGMRQSMSRVGRCIDNGPMEAFWGKLKTEMYYLRRFTSYDSLKEAIEEYIHFYNYRRYQEGLGCLAPMEYRESYMVVA
jgi:transposase InsO family protein